MGIWRDIVDLFNRLVDAIDIADVPNAFLPGEPAPSRTATKVDPSLAGKYAAQLDRARAEGWIPILRAAEAQAALPLGTLLALASRETEMQQIVGDGGHGRGLFQIDDRSHGAFLREHAGADGMPPVEVAAPYAAGLLRGAMTDAQKRGVKPADVERFAIAAYNAGPSGAAKGYAAGNVDRGTTKGNYSRDVLARRQHFAAAFGAASEAPPPAPVAEAAPGPPASPAPAVLKLRSQIDARWPGRPRSSDGIMGDARHQAQKSDHNEGNAIDVTRGAGGPDTRQMVAALLKDPRTKYVIHESRIYNPAIDGGRARPYSGPNPHTRHIHLSIKTDARDDDRAWVLEGVETLTDVGGGVREAIKKGLVWAMGEGLVDNVTWVELPFKDLVLTVSAEFLSVGGVRMPVSWEEELELSRRFGWIPITQAACDRRWELGERRLVLEPETPLALATDAGVDQVLRVQGKLPAVLPAVLTEGMKHWLLEGATREKPVNYGLWKADGTVWQTPGRAHNAKWRDYSQGITPVRRQAKLAGKPIDLYDRVRASTSGKYDRALLDYLEGK